jgi:hypothetical protein
VLGQQLRRAQAKRKETKQSEANKRQRTEDGWQECRDAWKSADAPCVRVVAAPP